MAEPNRVTNSRQKNAEVISLERGKIPPQAVELERVVLGAMLIDKKGVDEVIDMLHEDVFYVDAHQKIFSAIHELFQDTKPIDLLTVSNLLKQRKHHESVGGDFYLIELTRGVG
jgi:replicative DNA helicase